MAPLSRIPDGDTEHNDNDDDDAGNEWMRIVVGRNRIEMESSSVRRVMWGSLEEEQQTTYNIRHLDIQGRR